MAIESGVPAIVNGVQVGATDFREFTVGGGIPLGITEFGITPTSPSARAIANDPVEGNYFSMAGQGFKSWGFGLDSFDGKMLTGELLARVWFDTPVLGRKTIGGAASIEGLIGQSEPGADFDCWIGSFYRPVAGDSSGGFNTNNGISSDTLVADLQEVIQDKVWGWVRIRRLPNVGDPAKDDWTSTAWFGAIEDEPSSPDGTNIGAVRQAGLQAAAVGWAMPSAGAETPQRIAFLSFSADPLAESPPLPSDIATQWSLCSVSPSTVWAECS